MALLPTTRICGAKVISSEGESLGSITDVMIDSATGAIAYAVLAHGGLLGAGEKLLAVPWAEFQADPAHATLTLAATPAELDAASGIDKDAWPTEPPADWRA